MNLRASLFHSLYASLLAIYGAMALAWAWAIGRVRSGRPLLPAIKPRIVPWGARSTGAVIFTWIFTRLLAGDAFFAFTGHPRSVPLSFLEQMTLASLWSCLVLVMVPAVLRLTSRACLQDFGLDRRRFVRQTIDGAVAFLLVAIPINLINFLSVSMVALFTKTWQPNKHPVEKMVREDFSGDVAYLAVLSAVILAPAAEELIFRAVVQSWMFKATRGLFRQHTPAAFDGAPVATDIEGAHALQTNPQLPEVGITLEEFANTPAKGDAPDRYDRRAEWIAIVFTSILFALAHSEQWPAPVALFFLSLSLGFVFQRTGSLWSTFVVHALFNGLSTAVLFWSILGPEPSVKTVEPQRAPVTSTAPPSPITP